MAASRRYWAPKTAPSNVRMMLAVDRGPEPPEQAMDEATYLDLMREKVERLVEAAGPDEAARLLEMSPEQMPELEAIRSSQPQASWATALLNSDLMSELMRKINWSRETTGTQPLIPTQAEIRSALAEQTLQQLIETL